MTGFSSQFTSPNKGLGNPDVQEYLQTLDKQKELEKIEYPSVAREILAERFEFQEQRAKHAKRYDREQQQVTEMMMAQQVQHSGHTRSATTTQAAEPKREFQTVEREMRGFHSRADEGIRSVGGHSVGAVNSFKPNPAEERLLSMARQADPESFMSVVERSFQQGKITPEGLRVIQAAALKDRSNG